MRLTYQSIKFSTRIKSVKSSKFPNRWISSSFSYHIPYNLQIKYMFSNTQITIIKYLHKYILFLNAISDNHLLSTINDNDIKYQLEKNYNQQKNLYIYEFQYHKSNQHPTNIIPLARITGWNLNLHVKQLKCVRVRNKIYYMILIVYITTNYLNWNLMIFIV